MNGKVIVVTGALGALGRVVADLALARGARVASVDHAPTQVPATSNQIELGGVDLTDAAAAKKAIDHAAAHFGRLDALINIAGGFAYETVAEGDPKTWQRMYALNVTTTLNASRAAIPHLIAVRRGAYRQCRRAWRGAGGRRHGRLCRLKSRRASPDRGARRRIQGQDHRQRRAAVDHRHRGQSCRHAEVGFHQMGEARGIGRGDPVPRQRCRIRRHRRAAAGEPGGFRIKRACAAPP